MTGRKSLPSPSLTPRRQDAKTPREEGVAEQDAIAKALVDCAFKVHSALGPGFSESVYEEALCFEMSSRSIRYLRQPTFDVLYEGTAVGHGRLDLLVENAIIIELKSLDLLLDVHKAQVLSYLRATGLSLGFLINFNVPLLKYGIKRLSLSSSEPWRLGALASMGSPTKRSPQSGQSNHGE